MHVSDLRSMDIINISDGSRLGPVLDLELDLERGCVKGLVISMYTPRPSFWGSGGSGRGGDLFIGWDKVVKIGVDVILVNVSARYDHRFSDRYY
ncbi:MAG: YlmC/YmxH family sporulation protein [Peptococcaceae bacterium]|nr:YlmC/YmxH family sporulation protein [Peptococcaceae bacterium]